MTNEMKDMTKVAAHRAGVYHIMDALQIPCFFADGRYTIFRDDAGEYLLDDGIAVLEKRFAKCGFFMANRGTLVNSAFIKTWRSDGRFLELNLNDNLIVRVSKRRVPRVRRYLAGMSLGHVRGTKRAMKQ